MNIKTCAKCGSPMQAVREFGHTAAIEWVCVNELCGKTAKTCPQCQKQVLPESKGLGGVRYRCECGNEIRD